MSHRKGAARRLRPPAPPATSPRARLDPDEVVFDVVVAEGGTQETTTIVVTRTGHAYFLEGPIRRRIKGYDNLARAYASALRVVQQRRLEAAGLSQEQCGCVSKSGVVVRPCEQHAGGSVRP